MRDAVYEAAYFKALQDPKFAKLDSEYRRLMNRVKASIFSDEPAEDLTNRVIEVMARRNAMLETIYKPMLHVYSVAERKKRLMHSGLPEGGAAGFEGPVPAGLEKVYASLEKYAKKFPNVAKPNIIMSGATGTGKTVAVQTLGRAVLDAGHSVIYVTAFDMLNRIKRYVFDKVDSAFDDMLGAGLLIIDDLGTEPTIRNLTDEYFYNLVNQRLVALRPFVITTNLDRAMLNDRYGDRITSRLFAKDTTAVIELKGVDLRR